ncbi:NADH:flavin oxidoreductase [Mycolicibacterium thermoresistibile ATCC 19527]|uniref:NADH:flavin oxidoreductase n=3 Tax=Mycolicibacterium thermoresistibile TaxID=1797 RepID=G7CB32_MYCT3|nr:NADH:flavin oxidoreductase [Mycolicibacterium thermoresistibile ATCC 19527]GAT16242.1 NADH:flavin oxidoreductase [Mycolicibacterium thermoresistibile]SNW16987.1 NADPH dependent 2,4-dienoyl-CoA reductase FadH [Mycolicibacterium thermoresistibile]
MGILFEPITIGPMKVKNRIMVPAHGTGIGPLEGNEQQAAAFLAYYGSKAAGGAGWVGGSNAFVRNPLPHGFEPSGLGATTLGTFRHPNFLPNFRRWMDVLHGYGAVGTVQMILRAVALQGPSAGTQLNLVSSTTPHELEVHEIEWIVEEFAASARLALEAGIDGVEVHANHNDIVQWFLSPLTNNRRDAYGGSRSGRLKFLVDIVKAMRAATDGDLAIGVRLCMDEYQDGGWTVEDCRAALIELEATGAVDYFSLDVGNNWGAPSYIPPAVHGMAPWAELCGELSAATSLPVVYAGLVLEPGVAREVLAAGHADVVGMNRALIADPDLPAKTAGGQLDDIRPCIGVNDCISRVQQEGLAFGCAVNPGAGQEQVHVAAPEHSRRILVIGGGPAGMETAARAAERGHEVTLWERNAELGGAMTIAAKTPMHSTFPRFIEFQRRRLDRAGVTVELSREATADEVVDFGADVVVLATGASPRTPTIPGVDQSHVVQMDDVITGKARVRGKVVIIAQNDHMPPLAVADLIAGQDDTRVVMVYQSMAPAQGVGKYTIGAPLQRLLQRGTEFVTMRRVVEIEPSRVQTKDIFADTPLTIDDVDFVVLACGRIPNSVLARALHGKVPEMHILGDAYAPQRITFATRQAWALANAL